uniref:Uncharacterized protein n=1 Tax=Cucumis melo TaxID=3656 RepID=A0A9I9DSF8_CUCME
MKKNGDVGERRKLNPRLRLADETRDTDKDDTIKLATELDDLDREWRRTTCDREVNEEQKRQRLGFFL